MKVKAVVQPHGPSESAKVLAEGLGLRRLLTNGRSKWAPDHDRINVVVNWGSGKRLFDEDYTYYINEPEAVAIASDKLHALNRLQEGGINVPPFTTDPKVAGSWAAAGRCVLARQRRGHSGRDIKIIEPGSTEIPQAPLYTQYIPKKDEYRIHVIGGHEVDVQQKKRRFEDHGSQVDYRVRSYNTGWIYCREDVQEPPVVVDAALAAIECLGLDFGAVDAGWTRRSKTVTIYEVNTAPGLSGRTGEYYVNALSGVLQDYNRI